MPHLLKVLLHLSQSALAFLAMLAKAAADRKAVLVAEYEADNQDQGHAAPAQNALAFLPIPAQAAADRKAVLVAECEAELSKVMPPLLKVLKELRNIDKSSIAELKVRICVGLITGSPVVRLLKRPAL